MKLSNLILFAGAAAAAYKLVENRQQIQDQVTETSQAWNKAQASLARIRRNLDIIQDQKEVLADMSQDLSYKFKVLENQAQAQIKEIKDIWDK